MLPRGMPGASCDADLPAHGWETRFGEGFWRGTPTEISRSVPWQGMTNFRVVSLGPAIAGRAPMLLVLGGSRDGAYRNDVWRSGDGGLTWEEASPHDGGLVGDDGRVRRRKWSGRENFAAAGGWIVDGGTLQGLVYVIGGHGPVHACSDVWVSEDLGKTFMCMCTDAPFGRREGSGLAVCPGRPRRLVLVGGGWHGTPNRWDCWLSLDNGGHWSEVETPENTFQRLQPSLMFTKHGMLIVVGGHFRSRKCRDAHVAKLSWQTTTARWQPLEVHMHGLERGEGRDGSSVEDTPEQALPWFNNNISAFDQMNSEFIGLVPGGRLAVGRLARDEGESSSTWKPYRPARGGGGSSSSAAVKLQVVSKINVQVQRARLPGPCNLKTGYALGPQGLHVDERTPDQKDAARLLTVCAPFVRGGFQYGPDDGNSVQPAMLGGQFVAHTQERQIRDLRQIHILLAADSARLYFISGDCVWTAGGGLGRQLRILRRMGRHAHAVHGLVPEVWDRVITAVLGEHRQWQHQHQLQQHADHLEDALEHLGGGRRQGGGAAAAPELIDRGPGGGDQRFIAGSWDGWKELLELAPVVDGDPTCCGARVRVRHAPGVEFFQVIEDWSRWQYEEVLELQPKNEVRGRKGSTTWEVQVLKGTRWLEVVWNPRRSQSLQWRLLGPSGSEVTDASGDSPGLREVGPDQCQFFLVGSWDSWRSFTELRPMLDGNPVCNAVVQLQHRPVPWGLRFQVVQDQSWSSRFFPEPVEDAHGASSIVIRGPEDQHGANWEVWLPPGAAELRVTWDPRGSRRVTWSLAGPSGEPVAELPRHSAAPDYCLGGSWDGWRELVDFMPEEPANPPPYCAYVQVANSEARFVEFQIFLDRAMTRRFFQEGEEVVGPTARLGPNWKAWVPAGLRWLQVSWDPRTPRSVTWTLVQAQEEERRRRLPGPGGGQALPPSLPPSRPRDPGAGGGSGAGGLAGGSSSSSAAPEQEAPRRAPGRRERFYLSGSWDSWKEFVELRPGSGRAKDAESERVCYGAVHLISVPVPRAVKFQVIQDRDWAKRYYPDVLDGDIKGPHNKHGANWEVWLPARCTSMGVTWDPRGDRRIAWELTGHEGTAMEELPRDANSPEYSLAGSWDNWAEMADFMPFCPRKLTFYACVEVRRAPGNEEFQIFKSREWEQRFCPGKDTTRADGPSNRHGTNWHVEVPAGCRWLRVDWNPRSKRVKWEFIRRDEQFSPPPRPPAGRRP